MKSEQKSAKIKKYTILLLLIVAGSAIYELPYIRYSYYDVMMEALGINHTQMGSLMSAYGIGAMVCYFPGGWLADRISCKKLLIFSLLSTGAIGLYFATFPSYTISLIIHLLWAVTTTLTFWAAMIKATRMLGDSSEQGKMFGILEGGRGLLPMLYGLIILAVFNELGAAMSGFRAVVIGYSAVSIIAGILVLLFLADPAAEKTEKRNSVVHDILQVLKMPSIWLIALIIFSSYSVYTAQSYITPYLTDMFGMSVSAAAFIGLLRTYFIAIFSGPFGGALADKLGSSTKVLSGSFLVIVATAVGFWVIPASPQFLWLVIAAMVFLAASVFITRGIYFASLDEVNIPMQLSGAAIGFVSLIGFMPEAFIYTLIGNWLDRNPGEAGYKIMFGFMTAVGVAGFAACVFLLSKIKKTKQKRSSSI